MALKTPSGGIFLMGRKHLITDPLSQLAKNLVVGQRGSDSFREVR